MASADMLSGPGAFAAEITSDKEQLSLARKELWFNGIPPTNDWDVARGIAEMRDRMQNQIDQLEATVVSLSGCKCERFCRMTGVEIVP